MPYSVIKMGILVLWSLEGIHGPCIHTLLTLTRGHITTVRGVTGSPCARSTWSLYSLYNRDALTVTPSSRSTGTACDRLENRYTVPSITTRQCALPSPRRLLICTPAPTYCATSQSRLSRTGHWTSLWAHLSCSRFDANSRHTDGSQLFSMPASTTSSLSRSLSDAY